VFDACLMGDIEVAYELKDSVDYVVSSPAEILANGFPYQNIMQHVYKTPTDLVGVAKEYYEFYKNSSNPSATISVVKTSELVGVALEAKVIFNKYRSKIGQLDVSNIQRYFRYNKHWFYDVGDFITQLSSPAEAAPFIKSLNNAVIYKAATPDFLYDYGGFTIDPNKYSGLGIYIPTEPSDPELNEFYKKFKWNMDANLIQ
jgi:Clostripain family.